MENNTIIEQLTDNLKGFVGYVEKEFGTMPSGVLHKAAGVELIRLHQWSKNCIEEAERLIKNEHP
jgi:hypothetical protein